MPLLAWLHSLFPELPGALVPYSPLLGSPPFFSIPAPGVPQAWHLSSNPGLSPGFPHGTALCPLNTTAMLDFLPSPMVPVTTCHTCHLPSSVPGQEPSLVRSCSSPSLASSLHNLLLNLLMGPSHQTHDTVATPAWMLVPVCLVRSHVYHLGAVGPWVSYDKMGWQ